MWRGGGVVVMVTLAKGGRVRGVVLIEPSRRRNFTWMSCIYDTDEHIDCRS